MTGSELAAVYAAFVVALFLYLIATAGEDHNEPI